MKASKPLVFLALEILMAIYDIDKPNLKYPEIKGCFVRLEDMK